MYGNMSFSRCLDHVIILSQRHNKIIDCQHFKDRGSLCCHQTLVIAYSSPDVNYSSGTVAAEKINGQMHDSTITLMYKLISGQK